MKTEPLRICTTCEAPDHAENSPKCFGWGLRPNGSPLPAWALDETAWVACPVCGGTPAGRVAHYMWMKTAPLERDCEASWLMATKDAVSRKTRIKFFRCFMAGEDDRPS